MCQNKLPGVCMVVQEMQVSRPITRATSLLAESKGKGNERECNNEQLAIANNLKSFSAFNNERNPFQLLRELIAETYDKYLEGDHSKRHLQTVRFPDPPNCPGEEILARTYVMSKVVKLNECGASACEKRRRALEKAAPRCGWPGLEALVVTTLACWLPNLIHLLLDTLLHIVPEAGTVILRTSATVPGASFKTFLPSMIRDISHLPRSLCVDFVGVVDLCRWAYRIAYGVNWSDHLQLFGDREGGYNKLGCLLSTLKTQYEEKAFEITGECQSRGLCPNRLWNVCLLGAGGLADLPQISSIALQRTIVREGRANEHKECTEASCLLSHQNSTLLPQRHTCGSGNCGQVVVFPKAILNRAFESPQMKATTSSPPAAPVREHRLQALGDTVQNRRHDSSSSESQYQRNPSHAKTEYRRRVALDTIQENSPSTQEKYMAISHVWADGTGGSGEEVTACLVEYFTNIARQLGCSGIWWDAISLPTGPAKETALNTMLMNYENAAVTLVHDRELVGFNWATDGSPAVALVLSSWFTRGWTAAELFASRKHPVKVLFKNPARPDGPPLIKDLDDDILAWEPESIGPVTDHRVADERSLHRVEHMLDQGGAISRYGHFIATDIMRCLRGDASRGTAISSLRDLLLSLRARVTSWEKDRHVIPGLMCLSKSFDSAATGPQITRQVLTHFGKIFCNDLCHGEVPIRPSGPWSWCPPSIFDFSVSQNSRSGRSGAMCSISETGLIWGSFTSYGLARSDVVLPFGRHPAVASRVSEALSERENCLLLVDRNDKVQSHRQYILACPISIRWLRDTLVVSCRWAGCVYLGRADGIESLIEPHPDTQVQLLEIKQSNKRLRPKTPHNVKYLFGADSEKDQPFPTMSVLRLTTALDSYDTACINVERGSYEWVIGTEVRQEAIGVTGRVGGGRNSRPPVTTVAFIDEAEDHNHLNTAVWDRMIQTLLEIQPCGVDHAYHCGGIVNLAWSFPSMPGSDPHVLRRIFRTPFHLYDHYGENVDRKRFDMCIGWLTYSTEIAPRCSRKRGNGAQNDTYSQVILSSITQNSPDRPDWDKPLNELAPCHRRQGRPRGNVRNVFEEIVEEQRKKKQEQAKEAKPSRGVLFWKRERYEDDDDNDKYVRNKRLW
ncbi:hypothetical protein CHU98_g4706 [Xylaria longipes]|nr:hypothetical protein CHU98_g4706 [Xylaria longipes]